MKTLVVAAIFGLAFVFITPPFEVPDETAHYWRACAIARGVFQPAPEGGQGFTAIPSGERELGIRGAAPVSETRARIREDWELRWVSERVIVRYPLSISALPFIPQAIGIAIGDAFHLRPLIAFYLGRLLNLAASLALVLLAMRLFRDARWILCVCAMLPMTLFMFASFSPDAMTIGVTFVAIALALAGSPWIIAATIALALCKPYLLVPLLVLAQWRTGTLACPGKTGRSACPPLVVLAVAAGAYLSSLFAKTSATFMRPEVDPHAQLELVKHHPLHAAGIVATDLAHHAVEYGQQMIGTLGWLTIPLPSAVMLAVAVLLVFVALMAGPRLSAMQRLLAAIIAIASIVTVELSEYISWTALGANGIEGVQGRYFIPIAPLLLVSISRPAVPPRWIPIVIASVMTIVNGAAIFAMWQHYFRF
jgi:Predicted membrane protein (DUF2142)